MVIWEERCNQARGIIAQMVSDSLASLFDKFDDVFAYYLEKKIHELEPNNFDRIELYIAELKTLSEKFNSCGKYYKKMDTALVILVEHKLPSCFDMFIETRNKSIEMSKGTTKPTLDEFCKGLIDEQEKLISSSQLTPNKSLITHNNKNLKKIFSLILKVLVHTLQLIILVMPLMLLMKLLRRRKYMILVSIVVKLIILNKVAIKEND